MDSQEFPVCCCYFHLENRNLYSTKIELRGQCHEIFDTRNPNGPIIHMLKYFCMISDSWTNLRMQKNPLCHSVKLHGVIDIPRSQESNTYVVS